MCADELPYWSPVDDGSDDDDGATGPVARDVADDRAIASDVRALLDGYAGKPDRWAVKVDHGRVEVTGRFADPRERRVALALTRTVAGVRAVDLVDQVPPVPR